MPTKSTRVDDDDLEHLADRSYKGLILKKLIQEGCVIALLPNEVFALWELLLL